MDADAAAIAIVIPHYNDAARLNRCLAALMSEPEAAAAQIVVADNGSEQDLAPLRSAFPMVRVVTEPTKGAGAARNRGVAETTAPMLFFLDSDCVPTPGWIAAGRMALQGADIVGGRVTVFDETPPPRSGAEAFETVFAFNQKEYIESKGFSVSANLLTWRSVFGDVGGFGVGMSEDVDWCRRAGAKGYRIVYAPDVVVAHPTRSDMAALRRKWLRLTREARALEAGRPLARLRWAARAGLVLASAAVHAPRFFTDPRLGGWDERLRGLGVLLRLRMLRTGWMLRQALGLPV